MLNSITPYQIPQNQATTANAVNIQIFNPQAYAGGCATYSMPNQFAMPMGYSQPNLGNYQQTQANYQPITQSLYSTNSNVVNNQYPENYNNDLSRSKKKDLAPVSTDDKEKVEEDKKEEKKIVPLTDEYIMSLENYLNNQNPKIRLMGAKDVLDRFKEDKTRGTDVALTALLNKILQDPTETVRFIGLTTLDLGYAKGDDYTVQLLKQIQQDTTSNYGEDSLLASQILLKMSAGQ